MAKEGNNSFSIQETYGSLEDAFDEHWDSNRQKSSLRTIIKKLSTEENNLTQYLVEALNYRFKQE